MVENMCECMETVEYIIVCNWCEYLRPLCVICVRKLVWIDATF